MLASHEHRFQYVYFFFTGFLASVLLILIYISVRANADEHGKENLKLLQKTVIFTKPSTSWHYNNTWRAIGNSSFGQEVYSAYFDIRADLIDNPFASSTHLTIASVRIFAILPVILKDTISCIYRYDDFTFKEYEPLETNRMHEHHEFNFSAYSVVCPLQMERAQQILQLPQAVAITLSKNQLSRQSPAFVPISYPREMSQLLEKSRPVLSMCVGILTSHYADVLQLVEFIEMYRILGTGHFYFYHQDASDEIMRVLDYYRGIGLVEVFDWSLRQTDVHYNGQLAQINDCIYRANVVDNYRYAISVDLDEIIMPLKHNSLWDFMHQCDEGRTSAFVFRNVFFYKKDNNDTFSMPLRARNRQLYTQTKMRRTVEIMPPYQRSKCIANTRAIVEMGIHHVWRNARGFADQVVHQTVGLLFHYRDKCTNCKAVLMVDYTARRFGSLIWDRVDEICLENFLELNGMCPLS